MVQEIFNDSGSGSSDKLVFDLSLSRKHNSFYGSLSRGRMHLLNLVESDAIVQETVSGSIEPLRCPPPLAERVRAVDAL